MKVASCSFVLVWALVVGWQQASANDGWIAVEVDDCGGVAAPNKYIAITGCLDVRYPGTPAPQTTPPVAQNAVTNTIIYAKTDSNGVVNEAYRFRRIGDINNDRYPGYFEIVTPEAPGCPGIFAEFCTGSASNPCYLTVLSTTATDPLKLNLAYTPLALDPPFTADPKYNQISLFPKPLGGIQSLSQYATSYYNSLGYPDLPCGNIQFCYSNPQLFTPKPGVCSPTCPDCDLALSPPSSIPANRQSGETAYAVMCQVYPDYSDYQTNGPTTAPFAISFRTRQPLASRAPVGFGNWGWEIFWPKSTVPTTTPCPVRALIYAGQSNLVGVLTASIQLVSGNYVLSFTYDLTGSGNSLKEIHVYFSCTSMTSNAPGSFGTNVSPINAATYSGTASISSTDACPSSDKYLYLAFHAALA